MKFAKKQYPYIYVLCIIIIIIFSACNLTEGFTGYMNKQARNLNNMKRAFTNAKSSGSHAFKKYLW